MTERALNIEGLRGSLLKTIRELVVAMQRGETNIASSLFKKFKTNANAYRAVVKLNKVRACPNLRENAIFRRKAGALTAALESALLSLQKIKLTTGANKTTFNNLSKQGVEAYRKSGRWAWKNKLVYRGPKYTTFWTTFNASEQKIKGEAAAAKETAAREAAAAKETAAREAAAAKATKNAAADAAREAAAAKAQEAQAAAAAKAAAAKANREKTAAAARAAKNAKKAANAAAAEVARAAKAEANKAEANKVATNKAAAAAKVAANKAAAAAAAAAKAAEAEAEGRKIRNFVTKLWPLTAGSRSSQSWTPKRTVKNDLKIKGNLTGAQLNAVRRNINKAARQGEINSKNRNFQYRKIRAMQLVEAALLNKVIPEGSQRLLSRGAALMARGGRIPFMPS